MIYFVVHGYVDVHGGGGIVIVGLYRLLLLLLLLLLFLDFIFKMIYDLRLFEFWIVGLIPRFFKIFDVYELYRFNDIKHVLSVGRERRKKY